MSDILSMVVWTLTGVLVTRLYMHHYYVILKKSGIVETTVWNKDGSVKSHWEKSKDE